MTKKLIAGIMAAVMVFTGAVMSPATGAAAATKPGKVTITGSEGYIAKDKDSVGIKFSWNKVSGTKGYQYRYNLFYENGTTKAADFTKVITKKKAVKIGFQDNGNIRFQVRAFTKTNGKKVFGKWSTIDITEKQVEALIEQAGKVDLNGSWQDSVSQRAMMDVGAIGDGSEDYYLFTISWGSGATQPVATWYLSGKFDQETGVFTYENGTKKIISYDSNGNEKSSETEAEGLSGKMTYDPSKDTLTWNDSASFTGLDKDMVFVR